MNSTETSPSQRREKHRLAIRSLRNTFRYLRSTISTESRRALVPAASLLNQPQRCLVHPTVILKTLAP